MSDHIPIANATVGHHFGSLLQCPERAWQDYFGDRTKKLNVPLFLLQFQKEGIAHENEMCAKLYPDATRIPEKLPPKQRRFLTMQAIHARVPAILQAYLGDDDEMGVVDVLELAAPPSSATALPLYKVGEFKRALTIQTEHVLQVAWYTELLQRTFSPTSGEAFFILGDGSRKEVRLSDIQSLYDSFKAELVALRDPSARPGAHLCRSCGTCPWRGICIPELIATKHISLVPGIGRKQAQVLRDFGIVRWSDLQTAPNDVLESVGFDAVECKRIKLAITDLKAGRPTTRFRLRRSQFEGLTTISFSFPPVASADSSTLQPTGMCYEHGKDIRELRLDGTSAGAAFHSIAHEFEGRSVAVFGTIEMSAFQKLCSSVGVEPECLDVLKVIETTVHAPFIGLELAQLAEHIGMTPPSSAQQRVATIRRLVSWLTPVEYALGAA